MNVTLTADILNFYGYFWWGCKNAVIQQIKVTLNFWPDIKNRDMGCADIAYKNLWLEWAHFKTVECSIGCWILNDLLCYRFPSPLQKKPKFSVWNIDYPTNRLRIDDIIAKNSNRIKLNGMKRKPVKQLVVAKEEEKTWTQCQ